jgi:hypothetical protein
LSELNEQEKKLMPREMIYLMNEFTLEKENYTNILCEKIN